jgi:hypothetical protein
VNEIGEFLVSETQALVKDLMLMPLFATRVFAYNFRVIDIKIG